MEVGGIFVVNLIKLIIQIALLFVFYYFGEWIKNVFNLIIPGSVIGLIFMFLLLTTGILRSNWIDKGARFMNQHLVLFFIPATVGLLNYYGLFKGKGVFLIIITMLSTIFVMVSAGLISRMFTKRKDVNHE